MKSVVGPRLQESWNRFTRLSGLNSRLGFLLDTKYLLCNESVNNKSLDEECISLSRFYCSDLYSIELYDESCDCSMLARSGVNTILHTALELLTFIAESSPESLQQGTLRLCRGVHVFFFPNHSVALQIILTVCVSRQLWTFIHQTEVRFDTFAVFYWARSPWRLSCA